METIIIIETSVLWLCGVVLINCMFTEKTLFTRFRKKKSNQRTLSLTSHNVKNVSIYHFQIKYLSYAYNYIYRGVWVWVIKQRVRVGWESASLRVVCYTTQCASEQIYGSWWWTNSSTSSSTDSSSLLWSSSSTAIPLSPPPSITLWAPADDHIWPEASK